MGALAAVSLLTEIEETSMAYAGGHTVHPEELPWLPLAPKVFVKVLKVDRESGAYSVMIRAEEGGVLPPHRHNESAEIYIIKGEGTHAQTGAYREGDYISEPKGATHDALPFTEETVLLMIAEGPSEFLGEDGNVQHVMDIGMLDYLAATHGKAA